MSAPDTAAPTSVRVSRLIKADRQQVFRAWSDPQQLAAWFGPEGTTVTDVQVDLSPGGAYLLRIESSEGGTHTAVGSYREIDPPVRLSFTWDWLEDEYSLGVETLVTVDFVEREEGTEVRVTHEGFPTVEAAEGHEQGWVSSLNDLERHLA